MLATELLIVCSRVALITPLITSNPIKMISISIIVHEPVKRNLRNYQFECYLLVPIYDTSEGLLFVTLITFTSSLKHQHMLVLQLIYIVNSM